jgi:hypothetical protein
MAVIIKASSSATPGNLLYPIRVNILERIGSLFAFTKGQQAERTRELSGNRLDEAAHLLTTGGSQIKDNLLTLRNLFEATAAQENSVIAGVQKDKNIASAVTLANRYEADLNGFLAVLLKIRQALDSAPDQMDSLGVALDTEITKIKNVRTTLEVSLVKDEGNASYQSQAKSTLDETKNIIVTARKSLAEKKSIIGDLVVAASESQLKIAEGVMADAQTKIDAKKFGTALVLSNQAYRMAEAEKVFSGF